MLKDDKIETSRHKTRAKWTDYDEDKLKKFLIKSNGLATPKIIAENEYFKGGLSKKQIKSKINGPKMKK